MCQALAARFQAWISGDLSSVEQEDISSDVINQSRMVHLKSFESKALPVSS